MPQAAAKREALKAAGHGIESAKEVATDRPTNPYRGMI
jgi:hypothetical protein